MARIIKGKDDLFKKYVHKKLFVFLGAFVMSMSLFLYLIGVVNQYHQSGYNDILLLAFILGVVLVGVNISQYEIYKSGVTGEQKSVNIISSVLNDNYSVICNPKIVYDGKQSEMDVVVVGPNGVFIFEVKNYLGQITGDMGDHDWSHIRNERLSSFYSPVKQVSTHRYRLNSLICSKGVNVSVVASVFFVNEEAVVNITGNSNVCVLTINNNISYQIKEIIEGSGQWLSQNEINIIESLFVN